MTLDNNSMSIKPDACRKCGNTEFLSKEVKANGGSGPDLLPLGIFSVPKFVIVVCSKCGLTDWHVAPKYMDAVRERFDRMA
jgi:predicted nucleic-acid-binding Zn-ribbon protein